MKITFILLICMVIDAAYGSSGCDTGTTTATGQLFIIGGGKRPRSMMRLLVDTSHIANNDNVAIITVASANAAVGESLKKEFHRLGIPNANIMHFHHSTSGRTPAHLDLITKARLIFISGGKQSRFVASVLATPLQNAIVVAYKSGATVAGTSAGASVMSNSMMTFRGDKDVKRIELIPKDPMHTEQGLGLIRGVIIDQHFVKRQRMNRLIERSLENPHKVCLGIDESTAIIVRGQNVRVVGKSQVVVIRHPRNIHKSPTSQLLGASGMRVDVYVPGDTFVLHSCPDHTPVNAHVDIRRQNIHATVSAG